jgi:hypothetical protein
VIRGFCTGKYFSEYGLINLLMTAMSTCDQRSLFELSRKIHALLSPIAEFRQLWQVLYNQFVKGARAWDFIANMAMRKERILGKYFRVQFLDETGVHNYIYRETQLLNLWQMNERLKESAKFQSNGKEVEVVNEGEELVPAKLDPNKFYVHIKAVQQYFRSDDRKKRVTVFEQNHNVDKFYFDLPYSKTAQSSIEHCWLKRFIFKLPHPMPYIVRRVEVPPKNIEKTEFSPIEYSCQDLQTQIDRIEEALAREQFVELQPLLQGSLLTQVNEGPRKIAEVFLGRGGEGDATEAGRKEALRAVF